MVTWAALARAGSYTADGGEEEAWRQRWARRPEVSGRAGGRWARRDERWARRQAPAGGRAGAVRNGVRDPTTTSCWLVGERCLALAAAAAGAGIA